MSAALARILRHWRNAPPVTVVSCAAALPGGAPDDAAGAHLPGRVWIVDRGDVDHAATLAHEAIGHHGMRALLGSDWRQTMHAVSLAVRGGDPRFAPLSGRIQAVYRSRDGSYTLSRECESDEIVARVAEVRAHPHTAALVIERSGHKRLKAALGHFRRQVLYLDQPITMDELEGLLATSEGFIRDGLPLWHPERWWYRPAVPKQPKSFARPLDPYKPPMSLRRSERLLDKSGDLTEGLKSLAFLIGMIVLPIAFLGCLGYWAFIVFRALDRLLF